MCVFTQRGTYLEGWSPFVITSGQCHLVIFIFLFCTFKKWLRFLFLPHPTACGILVSQTGIRPGPLAVKVQSADHWMPGNSVSCTFEFSLQPPCTAVPPAPEKQQNKLRPPLQVPAFGLSWQVNLPASADYYTFCSL